MIVEKVIIRYSDSAGYGKQIGELSHTRNTTKRTHEFQLVLPKIEEE